MMNTRPSIVALVEFLDRHKASTLNALQSRHKAGNLLVAGTTMGEESDPDETNKLDLVYTETAIEGLTVALERIQPNIAALRKSIKKAKNYRMWGSLVSALSSTGLIAAILADKDDLLPIIAAVVNLTGLACVIFAEHIERPVLGDEISLAEQFKSLVELNVDAETLRNSLQVHLKTRTFPDDLVSIIQSANVLVSKLRKIELRLDTY